MSSLESRVNAETLKASNTISYQDYSKFNVNTDDLKVFFAFSAAQFEENLQELNSKFNLNLIPSDLCGASYGMVGVKEDVAEFYRRINE